MRTSTGCWSASVLTWTASCRGSSWVDEATWMPCASWSGGSAARPSSGLATSRAARIVSRAGRIIVALVSTTRRLPAMRKLLGPADQVVHLELLAVEAERALPGPEGTNTAGAQHAEVQRRLVRRDRGQREIDHPRAPGAHVPRSLPVARVPVPDE